jgi:hypothetical protein
MRTPSTRLEMSPLTTGTLLLVGEVGVIAKFSRSEGAARAVLGKPIEKPRAVISAIARHFLYLVVSTCRTFLQSVTHHVH